ncbi:RNA-directed DNA polymerase (Reverse transcriptase) [Candidatus Thiomargarita nelsonii]|uniref:RNA-directed DNA polymerase (Reverse transcriptase) n=1 Tax=Candidatus Thiomargarita nelsonii TaxID=1003181 RepID=A0A176S3R5_9GAMM|nr:RNA-directed DNA polymerase (Reverse transcriptase) [Candidatus Thiomargarita nelsonii]
MRVEPTKDKIKAHYREISETIWKLKAVTPSKLITILQPKISGWANYYKTVHSSEAFGKLDMLVWKRLYQWARRRHPQKGKKWIADKYFGTVNGRKWTFAEITGKGKDRKIVKSLKGYSKHKERTGSYAKVGFDRSYYDGDTAYWAKRLANGYDNIMPSKAKMLRNQKGICPHCGGSFTSQDLAEVHHRAYRSQGGEDKYSNLTLLHRHCHDELHRLNPIRRKRPEFNKAKKGQINNAQFGNRLCTGQAEYDKLRDLKKKYDTLRSEK